MQLAKQIEPINVKTRTGFTTPNRPPASICNTAPKKNARQLTPFSQPLRPLRSIGLYVNEKLAKDPEIRTQISL